MLEAGGYTRDAYTLANARHLHDVCVRLLVEDEQDYARALTYIEAIPEREAVGWTGVLQ
jgi:hypothetical protein